MASCRDGGCRAVGSRGAAVEVESISTTGTQSRPVSCRVSWAWNSEKHLRRVAQDAIWLADGSGRGRTTGEVLTTHSTTSTRLAFRKVQLEKQRKALLNSEYGE